MKYLRAIYLLLFWPGVFYIQGYSQSQAEHNYRLRCDTVMNYYASPDGPKNIFSVLAKYATGKADSSTAVFMDSILEHPKGEMFWMYPVAGLYFFERKNLPAEQKAKIWKAFTHYNADTGITENHKLMYYASLFLMSGEDEQDTAKWFDQRKSSDNYNRSGATLKAWMNKAFATGFAEFNSPHYGGYYLSPLLLLYDFSKDKEIRYHAGILIWRILGDYILHYRFSVFNGVSSRVIDPDIFNKKDVHMGQTMALFLGDRPVTPNFYNLFFAVSKFSFPDALYVMWKEAQKQNFVVMDAERSMTKIDGSEDKIISYLYSDSLYSLGSIIDGHNNEIQTRTWCLDWAGKGENNTLFGLNPFMSKIALAEYFPTNNIDTLYKNIIKQRPFYTDTNKWIGGSPYENLFQNKNALLGIYDFPDTLKNNSVSFFISNDIDSVKLENNILYAKTESIYFALRFSGSPVISGVQYGKRYRIRGKKPAFVLEVYHAGNYKSLSSFIRMVKPEAVYFSSNSVSFKSGHVQMQLNANGEKLFNGGAFSLPFDVIYSSDFITLGKGYMTIQVGKEISMFEWNKW